MSCKIEIRNRLLNLIPVIYNDNQHKLIDEHWKQLPAHIIYFIFYNQINTLGHGI